ncbi:MAG: hypothetical protein ACK5TK_18045 [Betaproteobacteria bacterium]
MKPTRFAMCISNDGYPASLEPAKFYRVLPDSPAAALGLLRVVDESGEDYLYPARLFKTFDLPVALTRTLGRVVPAPGRTKAHEAA